MLEAYTAFDEQFPWFFAVVSFAFGAIVGSFLNVCIYRIPAGKSIVKPGSTCACGEPIRWHDNIPIVSWILLRGKARCCGRPFSFRYPFVELLTGLLFLASWLHYPPAVALAGMLFVAILVCATFIDFDHMIIPDRFTIGGAVIGVAVSMLVPALHGFDSGIAILDVLRAGIASVTGVLIGSAVVLWIGLLAEVVLRKDAMGFGDVKFLGAIGAFTGWQGALFSIFGGAVIGMVGYLIFLAIRPFLGRSGADEAKKGEMKPPEHPAEEGEEHEGEEDTMIGRMVPFGPMLAAGGLVYFLFLDVWVDAYFRHVAEIFTGAAFGTP